MNSNLLVCSSRSVLLCLLSGFLLAVVIPAKANNSALQLSEQINSKRIRSISDANINKEFAQGGNEPILLSQSIEQVTSVSQLSDVQPTDWAFQALQSLVERYGCIAGYPDGTYRGNRALTRYEFAAGLNACLDRVNELIATATSDLARREYLTTIQRL